MAVRSIELVEAGEMDEYPISSSERLDSHYFMQFNHDRYDRSDFRRKAYRDPEVGFFGMELFFKSHGETPLGTLPVEDEALAFLLGVSLDHWRKLAERQFNPLYNWTKVRCDNGQVRLAHPVVTEVMQSALNGHLASKASNDAKAVYQRRVRLIKNLKDCGINDDLCNDEFAVGWIDEWLEEHHKGQRRMPQFQHSITKALRAAAAEGILGRARGNH